MTTQPTPITDKNGKRTTVHKKSDVIPPTARALPQPAAVQNDEPFYASNHDPKVNDAHYRANAEHYVPYDRPEFDRMCQHLLERDTFNLSLGRVIPVINKEIDKHLAKDPSFPAAYLRARASYFPVWIDGYRDFFLDLEMLAD